MTTIVVSREKLQDKISKAVEILPIGTCFVSGISKVKGLDGKHQMMINIVQSKNLKTNENKEYIENRITLGDISFKGNSRTVEVWMLLTIEGYEKTFPQLSSKISGKDLYGLVAKLKSEEVLLLLLPFNQMTRPSGKICIPTLEVKQYSNEDNPLFPQELAKILAKKEDERTTRQVEKLKSARMKTKEGELLVDQYGRQVYELIELTNGEDENVFVKKMLIDEYYEYVFDMKDILPASEQLEICKYLSKNESFLWTSELIERYSDKWDWDRLSKNDSIP